MSAKSGGGSDHAKRRAGEHAAAAVEDGMVVGLGTGSTTAYAIDAIGAAVDQGLDISAIPTSFQSRQRALEHDIPLTALDAVDGVDLAIDGADQVVDAPDSPAHGTLLKGGGGAHTREKLVASAADRFIVVADETKLVEHIDAPVPLEVLPAAHSLVADRLRDLEGEPTLRAATAKDGPVITDNGNLLIDCRFPASRLAQPADLATRLTAIPGVLEHGLFVDLADVTVIGRDDGVTERPY